MTSKFPLAPCELTEIHCQLIDYLNTGGEQLTTLDLHAYALDAGLIDPRDHVRFDHILDDLRQLQLMRDYSIPYSNPDGPVKTAPRDDRPVYIEATMLGAVILELHGIDKTEPARGMYGDVKPTASGGALYCPWLHWQQVSYQWHRARAAKLTAA